MALEDLQLPRAHNIGQLLAKTPNGTDAVALARRLGLWTTSAHDTPGERPVFPRHLATLSPPEISDEMAKWTAEFGRITELLGALTGQREQLKIRAKAVRAEVRSNIRKTYRASDDGKVPTATVIADEAEEHPSVVDVEEKLALVELLIAHTQAAKEATTQFITTLSREITLRDAQIRGKLYG